MVDGDVLRAPADAEVGLRPKLETGVNRREVVGAVVLGEVRGVLHRVDARELRLLARPGTLRLKALVLFSVNRRNLKR